MYPRKITIEDAKLKKLLTEKAELIVMGRAKSTEIEKLEAEMEILDNQMKEVQKSIDISDLKEKGNLIGERMEQCIKEMKDLETEINARLKEKSPTELLEKYDTTKTQKEDLETERNKIALKAQKYNDKVIPLGRKLMKPYLEDSFDDFDTIRIEDGEIVASIFNHLNDFKTNFKKK
jgi:phenylalanyl-tRNA synthetase alpha subunit